MFHTNALATVNDLRATNTENYR